MKAMWKPQVKKPAVSKRKLGSRIASRTAWRSVPAWICVAAMVGAAAVM